MMKEGEGAKRGDEREGSLRKQSVEDDEDSVGWQAGRKQPPPPALGRMTPPIKLQRQSGSQSLLSVGQGPPIDC